MPLHNLAILIKHQNQGANALQISPGKCKRRRDREPEMTTPQAWPQFGFDAAPVWKMYIDSMETWKRNCENLAKNGNGNGKQAAFLNVGVTPAYDNASPNPQKSGEELFKRFIEQQIELCRFFGNRWEQYIKFSEQVARCQSASELGQIRSAFLSQLATDYANEGSKVMQPFGAAFSNWITNRNR
jgi:hypothetical protein